MSLTQSEIQELVLRAIQNINMARKPEAQIEAVATARLFGGGSPLDSLGLVSLLIDIEEALQDRGHNVTLSDARAMSQSRSPFRSVDALVAYIHESLQAPQ
jgi:acyl carrier protein